MTSKPETTAWRTVTVCCLGCLHRWQAVYEGEPLMFECPRCDKVEGVRDE